MTPGEHDLVAGNGRKDPNRLGFAVLLKFFQFVARLHQVPDTIIVYLRRQLELPTDAVPIYDAEHSQYHYHQVLRAQLGVYLRMCDIAIPGMYGPSADETM